MNKVFIKAESEELQKLIIFLSPFNLELIQLDTNRGTGLKGYIKINQNIKDELTTSKICTAHRDLFFTKSFATRVTRYFLENYG